MTNDEMLKRALRGKSQLRERLKQLCKEHTERSKKLDALVADVLKADMTGQGQIAGTEQIHLDPDLADLLENACHGL